MNVYELLVNAAAQWPNQNAICDEMGALTYADLLIETEKFKKQLQAEGLAERQALGVIGKNSRQFIIAVFAGLATGAAIFPISNQLKQAEIEEIVGKTKLHLLISDASGPNLDKPNSEALIQAAPWKIYNRLVESNIVFAPHVSQAAFVRYTSGTTGKAKGVIICHQSVYERTEAANQALKIGTDDTVIWVMQMSYHFVVSIVLYLRYGATIAICKDFLAEHVLDYAEKFNGTLFYGSPLHIRMLAKDQSTRMFSKMNRVISTSTGISKAVCDAFRERYNILVTQAYGIIEIGLPIIHLVNSESNPEAVGKALDAYEVKILDQDFLELEPLQEGRLAIRGPGMFDAYLNPPKLRAEVMEQNWFLTGDLANKDESGTIFISGREKSMINVGGNKVFPEEVEAVLQKHPAVKAVRIMGGKHPLMGEIVEAEIVLEKDENPSVESLIKFCRDQLSTHKVPQRIRFVANLPMTDSGKIIRS